MATVAELVAVLRADTRQFTTAMSGAQAQTAAFGKATGAAFTIAGLAVAAGVAKSVDAFIDFETTMVRTVTLAGSTEDAMRRLSDSVLALAPQVGKGPQELAEALYFVQSSGVAASDAMEVVESAAKASAVGLGETQVVADAVTSVLNAYGSENITAAHATDILVAAVREGKGEADAIAGAIGRVIPIAANMGVEFDQVASAIASMTKLGLDANESVTALRGIMTSLLDPTQRAEETLGRFGFTVEGIQQSIKQKGLLATLFEMKEAFGGNERAMAEVFGNVRALVGALNLTGAAAKGAVADLDAITNSAGTTDEAFERLQETAGFKLKQAFAELQVAMIEIGGALAPIITQFAALAGAIAPVLPLLAQVGVALLAIKGVSVVQTALMGLGTSFGAAAAAATPWLAIAGGAVLLGQQLANAFYGSDIALNQLAETVGGQLTAAFEQGKITMEEWKAAIEEFNEVAPASEQINKWAPAIQQLKTDSEGAAEGMIALSRGSREAVENLNVLAKQREEFKKFTDSLGEGMRSAVGHIGSFERQWGVTSAQALRHMQGMATKATEMGRAYKNLDTEGVPQRFKNFLLQEGPAAVVAFASAPDKEKPKWVAAWREYDTAMKTAQRNMKAAATSGGREVGNAMVTGLHTAIREGSERVAAEAAAMVTKAIAAAKAAAKAASPSQEMMDLGEDMVEGLRIGLSRMEKVRDAATSIVDAIKSAIEEGDLGKEMLLQAKEFEAGADAIVDRLEKLQERVSKFREGIKSGFSDFKDLVGGLMDQEDLTPGAISAYLSGQVASAQQFAAALEELQALGLRPALLAEIAAQGPEALPFIQALLAGGSDLVEEFNATQKAMNEITKDAMKNLTEEAFGQHFKAASKAVKDFVKNANEFMAALQTKTLGREIAGVIDGLKALRQALSRIGRFQHGGISPGGLAVVGERGPELVTLPAGSRVFPNGSGPAVGGGGYRTANVIIEIDGRAFAAVIGQRLVDEVRVQAGVRR